jgi:hypothetical protein
MQLDVVAVGDEEKEDRRTGLAEGYWTQWGLARPSEKRWNSSWRGEAYYVRGLMTKRPPNYPS